MLPPFVPPPAPLRNQKKVLHRYDRGAPSLLRRLRVDLSLRVWNLRVVPNHHSGDSDVNAFFDLQCRANVDTVGCPSRCPFQQRACHFLRRHWKARNIGWVVRMGERERERDYTRDRRWFQCMHALEVPHRRFLISLTSRPMVIRTFLSTQASFCPL